MCYYNSEIEVYGHNRTQSEWDGEGVKAYPQRRL